MGTRNWQAEKGLSGYEQLVLRFASVFLSRREIAQKLFENDGKTRSSDTIKKTLQIIRKKMGLKGVPASALFVRAVQRGLISS